MSSFEGSACILFDSIPQAKTSNIPISTEWSVNTHPSFIIIGYLKNEKLILDYKFLLLLSFKFCYSFP